MIELILFVLLTIIAVYVYNTRQLLINTIDIMNKNTAAYNETLTQDRARIEELELAAHARKGHRKL